VETARVPFLQVAGARMEVETHPKPETRIEAAVGDAQATGIDDSEGRLESENPEIEEGKPARGGSSLKPGDVPEKLFGELDNEIAPPIRTRQIGMIVSGDPHPDPAQEVSDKENSLVPGAGIKDKEDPGVKPGQPGLESDPQETKKAHSSSLASGGVSEVQPQAGGGGLEAKSAHDMVKPDSKPPQENLVGDGTPVDTIVIEAKDSTSVMEEKPVADVASPANGTNGIHKLGKASGEVSTSLDSKAEPLQDKKAEVETSQESKRISQTEEDVLKLFRFKYQCSFCNHCATQIQFPIDSLVVQCPKCNKHVSALTPRNTECFNCKEMLAHPSTANFIQCPKCLFLMNPKDSERKSYPPTFEPVKPAAGKKRKRVSSEDTLNAVAFNLYRQEHWVAMRNQSGVTDVMKLTNLLKETWKNLAPKVRETYERAAMASNQQSQSKKAVMHTVPPLGRGSMQQQAQANAAAMHHAPQYSLNQVRIEVQQANERFQQVCLSAAQHCSASDTFLFLDS